MTKPITGLLEFYSQPSLKIDPGEHAGLLEDLPTAIPALCQVVQGLLLHIFWAERHGIVP